MFFAVKWVLSGMPLYALPDSFPRPRPVSVYACKHARKAFRGGTAAPHQHGRAVNRSDESTLVAVACKFGVGWLAFDEFRECYHFDLIPCMRLAKLDHCVDKL